MEERLSPCTVAFYDGAVAPGGALGVLSALFDNIDRSAYRPRLLSAASPAALKRYFDQEDIALARRPRLSYPERFRMDRILRRFPPVLQKLAAYLFSLLAQIVNLPANIAILLTLLRERPSLLHVDNSTTPLLWAWLLGIPVVWHIHEVPSRRGVIERMLMKSVQRFIAISEYVSQAAINNGYPSDRLTVIHNPAPDPETIVPRVQELHERFSIPAGHAVIAHVGRLVPWKGQLEFLQAFNALTAHHSEITALIVGDDAENLASDYVAELKRYVDIHGLNSRVRFTGHTTEILALMASVDIIVHSSTEPEPFGLVITEAMSAGTVVVAARSGAPTEIIESGETGLLINPGDTTEFCTVLASLVENEDRRREIAARARKSVQERFSARTFTNSMVSLYKTVLAKPSVAPSTGREPRI